MWYNTLMFKRFKYLKFKNLICCLFITLAYPAIKALRAETNKLLLFTDSLTVIGFIMLILGILYNLSLKGDFDRTRYILDRSLFKNVKGQDAYMEDLKKDREESFNYPLWLGIFYIVFSVALVALFF